MAKSAQEIFDIVAAHLLKQNARSVRGPNDEGYNPKQCMYRGKDGRMCAVGVLITDEAYDASIENRPVVNYEVLRALVKSEVLDTTNTLGSNIDSLLSDLQSIHDMNAPASWKDSLRDLTARYYLEWKHD